MLSVERIESNDFPPCDGVFGLSGGTATFEVFTQEFEVEESRSGEAPVTEKWRLLGFVKQSLFAPQPLSTKLASYQFMQVDFTVLKKD